MRIPDRLDLLTAIPFENGSVFAFVWDSAAAARSAGRILERHNVATVSAQSMPIA
jgi:hypothetical protein